jgi:hypothetical protein
MEIAQMTKPLVGSPKHLTAVWSTNMRVMSFVALSLCLALTTSTNKAQSQSSDGNVRTNIQGIEIPPIPNAPFTAKVVVTWNQPLVGGGTISRSYYTLVARDSQGRVHREVRNFVPANSNAEPPLRSISITDPIAGTRTTCSQETMNCSTTSFQARLSLNGWAPQTTSSGGVKRVPLGQQLIDNLPATGMREISTASAGEPGNSQLVVSNREIWFSPDLQIDLSVTRNNPQLGVVTLSVTDLVRGEPDQSWFAVPSGYGVNDARSQ